jgi:hypothetical protein
MDGNNRDKKAIVVFRPDSPLTTLTVSTFTSEAAADPVQQTVSAAGRSTPVIVLGGAGTGNAGTVAFSVASPAFDSTATTASELSIGYKFYNAGATPADHSIDVASGINRSLWGGYLEIS